MPAKNAWIKPVVVIYASAGIATWLILAGPSDLKWVAGILLIDALLFVLILRLCLQAAKIKDKKFPEPVVERYFYPGTAAMSFAFGVAMPIWMLLFELIL